MVSITTIFVLFDATSDEQRNVSLSWCVPPSSEPVCDGRVGTET